MNKIFFVAAIVLLVLLVVSNVQYSYALSCAGPTIEKEFLKSKWVFLGKFISETESGIFSENTVIKFKVIETFKGDTMPTMKVLNNPDWRHFFSLDEVLIFAGVDLFGNPQLFLCTNSGETSKELISKVKQLSKFLEDKLIMPPRMQIKIGVEPENILCRENMVLIFKATDYSPSCVKKTSAQKLLERGWTKSGKTNIGL